MVRNKTGVFLIIAQDRFAARAWPAVALDSGSGMAVRRWAFDLSSSFVWLFTANIEDWFSIDITWTRIPFPAEAGRFGYVVAQECPSDSGAHVPAIVDAFLHRGHHRLIRTDRKQFCEELSAGQPEGEVAANTAKFKYSGQPTEVSLFEKLLDKHPRKEEMIQKLSDWWTAEDKRCARRAQHTKCDDDADGSEPAGTSSEEHPATEECALTMAALEGLDEHNCQEWKKEKRLKLSLIHI